MVSVSIVNELLLLQTQSVNVIVETVFFLLYPKEKYRDREKNKKK